MLINTRKILASIGLLIAIAGWHCSCFGETSTIRYDSVFSPPLPTAENDINTSPTSHSCNNYEFGEVGIYKGNGSYIMFVKNKGYLYNTESLGHIDSVIVSYSSNVSLSAKFGVRFADTIMYEQITKGNTAIKGKSASDTVANNDPESGGYFQLSTSSANCQIVSIKIVYTQGNTPPPIDNIPPVFTTGYPKTDGVDKNKFDLKVKTDEPCTVFYMVVSEGETEPTKDELLASDKTISVETKNTEYFATVSGLEPATTYKIYLIAKDMADNVQEDSTTITATTLSAFVKTIALGNIETKYYWGETANIKWTINNIDAATDQDSIIIYKNNQKILKYPIDITSGEADILIGNGSAPDGNTYGTDYKLKIISGNIESELSANFTIVPTITINRLMTDINSGHSDFINDNVRMKGLVTGVKSKALTIQDGMGDFCATYITNNPNTNVEIHDSVYWEVAVSQSNGSVKATTKQVTIINNNNQPQTPRITELGEIDANNGLKYLVVTIKGVTCQNRVFYKDNDAIHYVNTLFSNSNNYFKENRKFDISGVLNIGAENKKEIWPRSQVPEDFYLYSNDYTLAELTIGGRNAMNSDTIVFTNLTINGISATANDAKASLSIRVNNTIIASSEWEGYNFSPLDSVFVTVTAEDGTEKTYKRVIDCKTLNFNTLANNSFGTGETINLSWTSHNISQISLILEIQNSTISLTESAINADLSEWQYTIPNSMFGEGWIKAVSNGTTLDNLFVNISDTRVPTVTQQNPTNCSSGVKNSLYVSIVFDEPVLVAEDAKLIVNNLEFPIIPIGDSAVTSFINGLSYSTSYNISLSNNAICDLAGNAVAFDNWSFTTTEAPQPDLYFSEYANGSGNNKYYEIYNPCDTTVDLSRYFVTMDEFKKDSRQQTILQLSGMLMPNEVLVVANSSASAEIKQMTDVSTTKTTSFTGDDLLGLFRKNGEDTVLIDVLGPFGNCETAANWAVAGVKNASAENTIVRKIITCGTTDWGESAGTDSFDSQWTVLEQNVLSSLGRHGIGHNAEILRMSIGGVVAEIDKDEAIVSVEVPYGTDLTELPITSRISQGAQMFINNALAADIIDFSQPVTATIVAGDGIGQKNWTINVTTEPKPSSDILTFSFVETTPVKIAIDTASATIDAVVAYNLDSLKLTPVITISEFASVSSTLFKSSKKIFTAKTKWDFSKPQTIKVTAKDLTEKIWAVTVARETTQALTIKDISILNGSVIATAGKPVSTEGVVTHIATTTNGTEFYIQDNTGMWSGLMVADKGGQYTATLKVGDRINVSGIVEEYFGMVRIGKIESLTILNSGDKILSDTIIIEDARSNAYQNAIVTIDSVICAGGFDYLFKVIDSTNSIIVYNKYRINDFELAIDSMYRITGIVYYTSADNSYRIIPRTADDIVKLARTLDTKPIEPNPIEPTPIEPNPIEPQPQEPDTTMVGIVGLTDIGLTAYTVERTIIIENADAAVAVFDIAGKLIATARPAQRIVINAPHTGIYIVKTRQKAIKVAVE